MSAMREAFYKWASDPTIPLKTKEIDFFDAGWQACLQHIKNGGIKGYLHLGDPDSDDYKGLFEELNDYCPDCVPLYKLEDES
jgi:hypothetical protein